MALALPPAAEGRKTVTVLFCDLSASPRGGRGDAETLRRFLVRAFGTARQILERHGGTVETYIGDAVMAVFGVPAVHEDDALRAVRAAAELLAALRDLDASLGRRQGFKLTGRIGIHTGEVVASDPRPGHNFATGDTVNLAARFKQAARHGQALLSGDTLDLVRDAVTVEPRAPLRVKGKPHPVPAYRLLGVRHGAPARRTRSDAPLIGRDPEQALLTVTFERVLRERACHTVTLLGAAGMGKSRLAGEFAGWAASTATVLRGRCLPYGDGITYWPIVQMVRQAAGITADDTHATAQRRLADLLAGEPQAARLTRRVAQLLGLADGEGVPSDLEWAVRRLLEALARRRPLVALIEDLHWAEPTLLDLIDHVATWSRDAPLLLLCTARLELLEQRPRWGGGRRNASNLLLSPLGARDAERLLDHLLGQVKLTGPTRARVLETAEGNPLFLEELVGTVVEGELPGHGMPRTIQAVLAARLDRLPAGERALLQRAAVIGKQFLTAELGALTPEPARGDLATHLAALVRKQLIQPGLAVPTHAGNPSGFRFRHILIRDVAYQSIHKATRAELHARYAAWLEQSGGATDEITGYHLAEAYHYREELGQVGPAERALARKAGTRLAAAGRRAAARSDAPAALRLLSRATQLLDPEDRTRLDALADLADAHTSLGDPRRAAAAYDALATAAAGVGEAGRAMHARLGFLEQLCYLDLQRLVSEGPEAAGQAIDLFEDFGDDLGQARAWCLLAQVHAAQGRSGAALAALDRAMALLDRLGNERWLARAKRLRLWVLDWGPTPLPSVEQAATQEMEWAGRHGARALQATALRVTARALAARGEFARARELLRARAAIIEGLGDTLAGAGRGALTAAHVELLAGDPVAAEQVLREARAELERIGARGPQASVTALLAYALLEQGRYQAADGTARACADLAAHGGTGAQVRWRAVRARVLAARGPGEAGGAERLAREAVRLGERSEEPEPLAEALLALAEVPTLSAEEAAAARARALTLYQRKGNTIAAGRALRSPVLGGGVLG